MFVLCSKPWGDLDVHWDGYYTGKRYQYQGESYAVVSTDIHKAKKYKSNKIAQNALNKLGRHFVNYEFYIMEVGE